MSMQAAKVEQRFYEDKLQPRRAKLQTLSNP
jgi:hypothetical protein